MHSIIDLRSLFVELNILFEELIVMFHDVFQIEYHYILCMGKCIYSITRLNIFAGHVCSGASGIVTATELQLWKKFTFTIYCIDQNELV